MLSITEGQIKITDKKKVARDTLRLRFEVIECAQFPTKDPIDFTFQPGQFLNILFGEKDWRSYSIASHPSENIIELVIRLIPGGVGSETLRVAQINDIFTYRGCFGHFILSETKDHSLVFIGTGTGIAPFRSMILEEHAKINPRPMHLWYGGRDTTDIAYLDEIFNWHPHINLKLCFSRTDEFESYHQHAINGRVTALLIPEHLPTDGEYYLCGNGDMVDDVTQGLLKHGVEKSKIKTERFN